METPFKVCVQCKRSKPLLSFIKNNLYDVTCDKCRTPKRNIDTLIQLQLKTALISYEIIKNSFNTFYQLHGCTVSFMYEFLEFAKPSTCQPLHIDHLFPVSRFNDNRRFLHNWSNLRYLTAQDNIAKTNRLPYPEEVMQQIKIINAFLIQTGRTDYDVQQLQFNTAHFHFDVSKKDGFSSVFQLND